MKEKEFPVLKVTNVDWDKDHDEIEKLPTLSLSLNNRSANNQSSPIGTLENTALEKSDLTFGLTKFGEKDLITMSSNKMQILSCFFRIFTWRRS